MRKYSRRLFVCLSTAILIFGPVGVLPEQVDSYQVILTEMEQVSGQMQDCGLDLNCINRLSGKLNALSQALQQATPAANWPMGEAAGDTSADPQSGGAAPISQIPIQSDQGAVPTEPVGWMPGMGAPDQTAGPAQTAGDTARRTSELRVAREHRRKEYPPSTVELIAKAEEEGSIDRDTSLLYKAYAVFGDRRLPDRYRSDQPFSEATSVFADLRWGYNSLSPRVQKALIPFLVNPLHPESIFNRAGSVSGFSFPSLISNAHADTRIPVITHAGTLARWKSDGRWESLVTANRKTKIWYKRGSGDWLVALESKKFFDSGWIREKLVGLMGVAPPMDASLAGDDGLFDIWFYPIADYGLTYALEDGKNSASTIIIRRSLRGKMLAATLAHEFFHAIQYNFMAHAYADSDFAGLTTVQRRDRINKRKKTDEFLRESTATWSEDFVFKDGNTEQIYLKEFFDKPQLPLYDTSGTHEYGAYLFHFYFEQKYGPQFMREIWRKREQGKAPLQALKLAVGSRFKQRFNEFSLWNWNRDPLLLYRDAGKFPKSGMKYDAHTLDELNLLSGITSLAPLSADYLKLKEKDPAVRKLRFQLKEFNAKADTGIHAIIKIRNRDIYAEDWSHDDEKVFCLDNPDQDLEKIILVHVNSSDKNAVSGITQVQRSHMPCSPRLELALTIKGEQSETSLTSSGDTRLTDSSSISGSANLKVIFKDKPVFAHLQYSQAPTVLVPSGDFSYDLNIRQWGSSETKGGWYRPPLGAGVLAGKRYSEGNSGRHDMRRRITARASWKGQREAMTLYQPPSVTMDLFPVEGSDAIEYSINLNVDGRYSEERSTYSSSGKTVNGVITAEPIQNVESDAGEHPVMLELKIRVPKGRKSVAITEEHVVDKELIFPPGDGSIVSYPKASLGIRGKLELFQSY